MNPLSVFATVLFLSAAGFGVWTITSTICGSIDKIGAAIERGLDL